MRIDMAGRDAELAVLDQAIGSALDGATQVILCCGEPGIGKTRLAEEARARAAAQGLAVVWGTGVADAGAPPLWPWRQIFRGLREHCDVAALTREVDSAHDLRWLAEELPPPRPPLSSLQCEAERFAVSDATARLLARVTRELPLLVVLDDVQWADAGSLLLLRHVVRTVRGRPLLLLIMQRSTEPGNGPLLAELLADPATVRLELKGLDAAAVGRVLNVVVGERLAADSVGEVRARTGGNPFLVTELGRLIRTDGAGAVRALPTSVRDVVAARLARLSPGCRQLLSASAILGLEFTTDVVARTLAMDPLTCAESVREAETGGFVVAASVGRWRFAHALVRDAVVSGLGALERVTLSRTAAGVVEQLYAAELDHHLGELARLWTIAAAAGERDVAASWIERAGHEALRRRAFEEAAGLFQQALDVGAGAIDEVTRCRLLLALGSAAHLCADIAGRLRACLEAAAVARRLGRADLQAEAALCLEGVGETNSDRAARALADEAIAALGTEPSPLLARVTARLAEVGMYLGDPGAEPASRRALAIAERTGDPGAMETALTARLLVVTGPGDVEERARLGERMQQLGPVHRDTVLRGRLFSVSAAFERGDLAGVHRDLDPLSWCADEVGGSPARWQVLATRATLAQSQARFAEARALLGELRAVTPLPLAHAAAAGLAAALGHHLGHDVAAVGELFPSDRRAATVSPFHTRGVLDAIGPGYLFTLSGQLTQAAACYAPLGPVADWHPRPHVASACYALGVVVAAALDRPDDLAELRHILSHSRGRYVTARVSAVPVFWLGPVELWLGKAARHLGLLDDAVEDLLAAAAASERAGAPGFAIEARYELAAALSSRDKPGDVARARALAGEAAGQARTLAMTPLSEAATALQNRLDTALAGPLTRRELGIAALVAEGLTNREIAQRLQLSERTVQNHVQHVLTKLGLGSRRQVRTALPGV
ncbi:MAG: AAA family ATPase [Jatrophihabitans sp.]|uniref:ATP-binding protein n=1 Tax=Jatrophihabitans sp. TaxID=1932789 RepID=UPI00390EAD7E